MWLINVKLTEIFLAFNMYELNKLTHSLHGVQHRMISVDNFFVFLILLFFALLLLYET